MVSDMKHQTDAAGRGSIVKYSRVSQRCQHTMVHVSLCPHAVEPTSHCAFVSLHLDIAAAPFHSGELWTRKLKSHLLRTQSLKILPLKPGVGQYIAIHATPTARDFFLANFYPSGPLTCIFFQNLSRVFPVFASANAGSCVGP